MKEWAGYTTDNGLVDNTVLCITVDSSDALWFGTSRGLSCLEKKQ